MFYDFRPYVPVAERRRRALREMEKRRKKGHPASPVVIEGRQIARTFWGQVWCHNLEAYRDYANRLPRGKTYARNGSVVDLQIGEGHVKASVAGSELYEVEAKITALPAPRWTALRRDCAGGIDSLVELLQGRFSKGVMERLCRQESGLFPAPKEIRFSCTCPDWASMCKHVAAALYGVGARLDAAPELLFKLRAVEPQQLLAAAGAEPRKRGRKPSAQRLLAKDGLSELFGLEMVEAAETPPRKKTLGERRLTDRGRAASEPTSSRSRKRRPG